MSSPSLGSILRKRRQQLELTQQHVAREVGVRANYVGYIERDMRRPSTSVLVKLARVLDLDREELFFLAHPSIRPAARTNGTATPTSAWDEFRSNKRLHTRHGITRAELRMLEHVAALGAVYAQRDYLFILQTVRQALQAE